MSKRTLTPEPATFPDPHRYGTWLPGRSPQFKTHSDLGKAKNAVSGSQATRPIYRTNAKGVKEYVRQMTHDAYVYEWDPDTGWSLVHHYTVGTVLPDDPWHKTPQATRRAEPSEKQVNAAIASIMGAVND